MWTDNSDSSLSLSVGSRRHGIITDLTRFTMVCTDGRENGGKEIKIHQVSAISLNICVDKSEIYAEIRIYFLVPDVHSRSVHQSEAFDRNKKTRAIIEFTMLSKNSELTCEKKKFTD